MASGPVVFGTRKNGHLVIGGTTSELGLYVDLALPDVMSKSMDVVIAIEDMDSGKHYVFQGEVTVVPRDKAASVYIHCLEGEDLIND